MKFIKKPIVIEAIQWYKENSQIVKQFVKGNLKVKNDKLYITTLEGDVELKNRDFIIKGINGEFYPCPEKKFNNVYTYISGTAYRKNPVEVEAVKFNGHLESICDFCSLYKMNENGKIMVSTSDNRWLEASEGDYIVKESDENYYPVKPDIFKKTYEEKK